MTLRRLLHQFHTPPMFYPDRLGLAEIADSGGLYCESGGRASSEVRWSGFYLSFGRSNSGI